MSWALLMTIRIIVMMLMILMKNLKEKAGRAHVVEYEGVRDCHHKNWNSWLNDNDGGDNDNNDNMVIMIMIVVMVLMVMM